MSDNYRLQGCMKPAPYVLSNSGIDAVVRQPNLASDGCLFPHPRRVKFNNYLIF